jgi:hypothetical protein
MDIPAIRWSYGGLAHRCVNLRRWGAYWNNMMKLADEL